MARAWGYEMKQTRRGFLKTLAAAPVIASIAGCRSEFPPNILVLCADDMRSDMFGEGGNGVIGTPNIDRLARDGVLFENNFVTTSICPVSRASIFTGLYARCHGVHGFKTALGEELHGLSYPHRLRNAGYRTGFVGKYGVPHAGGEEGAASRFDYFKGVGGQGHYVAPGRAHLTEHLGDQASEFLESSRGGEPWNLSVSFKAPHVQDEVPPYFINDPRFDDLYDSLQLPPFSHMDGRYYDSLPEFLRAGTESRIRWERRFSSPEKWEESVKRYYALIHGLDVQVGRILGKIEAMRQLGNTVIIFTSDNGFFLGERGWAGKWYMHEESIRTPMIVCDPRRSDTAGVRRREMTLNIDVCPTILDLADLAVPDSMNGRALTPLLRGEGASWRHEWFYEHLLENPKIPKSEGIRRDQWKYFVFPETGPPPYEEMYDLTADPRETVNLATSPDHEEIRSVLRSRREVWIENLEAWSIDRPWVDPT